MGDAAGTPRTSRPPHPAHRPPRPDQDAPPVLRPTAPLPPPAAGHGPRSLPHPSGPSAAEREPAAAARAAAPAADPVGAPHPPRYRTPPDGPGVRPPVVVVGAGAAGLAAAGTLAAAGADVLVLEAAPAVGGRLTATSRDGFRLDRRPLLLNLPADRLGALLGPEPAGAPFPAAALRPGVLIRSGGRLRRSGGHRGVREAYAGRSALAPGTWEEARLGVALRRLAEQPAARVLERPERTAAAALALRGTLRTWPALRPLLTALLSDPGLTTSSRYADLVLRDFARHPLLLPAGGAAAVSRRLAAPLPPDAVRTGVEVVSVAADGVRTARHGTVRAGAVVVATRAPAAGRLLPGLRQPRFHPVRTLYHALPSSPLPGGAALLVDDDGRSPVAYSVVVSDADPSSAPPGAALLATVVLDQAARQAPEAEVRGRLGELYGTATTRWRLLDDVCEEHAVPAVEIPMVPRRPVRLLGGLYVCGDHRDAPTLLGAVMSGRRAARQVLRDLGAVRTPAAAA